MPDAIVPLSKPIVGHGGQITELVLREPRAQDFWDLGDPWVTARGENGEMNSLLVPATVSAYIGRLAKAPELLPQVSFADGMRVRDAVLGFFADAAATAYGEASPSSSGMPASAPPPSGSI